MKVYVLCDNREASPIAVYDTKQKAENHLATLGDTDNEFSIFELVLS